jgi:hypothetical protein
LFQHVEIIWLSLHLHQDHALSIKAPQVTIL